MDTIYKTMDGNEAAAYASYAFTEIAAIYPITPSSPMAECVDQWAAEGKKNIFGDRVQLVEMQSEAGAVSAVHGALDAGMLAASYTASQGLMLMIPTMFRIAGELKPCVIHVASRNVATHAISINAEHSDVMACRQTGFAMLASSSVQEAMDLGAVAHLSAIAGHVPFLHFFDGFRTSHELQKIRCLDYDELAKLVDYDELKAFRARALDPAHPLLRTAGQYADTYFQSREACNSYYDALPTVVKTNMDKLNALLGTDYRPYVYYGAPDAETVLVGMGSLAGTARETVDWLILQGRKVGYLDIHLYRPMSAQYLLPELPATVRTVTVCDRTKEPGAVGEPLYEDICALLHEHRPDIAVLACRYGLAGKDTTPAQLVAMFDNMDVDEPRNHVTVGINDDVTHLSLCVGEEVDTAPTGTVSCKFWGLGSDGTVGANKNSIKIIGDHTDMNVQAFFEYDGRKSGGVTRSHLRFGKAPICSEYLVSHADFVACSNKSYLFKYDITADLRRGGKLLINCDWDDVQLEENLPASIKRAVADKQLRLFVIDAGAIARRLGLGNKTNTILQAAFFRITGIIPPEDAEAYLKDAIVKSYSRKGEDVVKKNFAAVDGGMQSFREINVPKAWTQACDHTDTDSTEKPEFVRRILEPVNALKGDSIPVSDFAAWADGSMPQGTSRYEQRAIADLVPIWSPDKCIQCNMCSFVCPHAAIRPFLLTENEAEGMQTAAVRGETGRRYRMQVAALDCVGCGSCVECCPVKDKAISMKPLSEHMDEAENWDKLIRLPTRTASKQKWSVNGSQYRQPLLEFPGACPGCGETPYAKLITQLFGDRMLVATATGCSQVWCTSFPSFPYTTDSSGRGPAVGGSLFENNAEYGLGMALSAFRGHDAAKCKVKKLAELSSAPNVRTAAEAWLEGCSDAEHSVELSRSLLGALSDSEGELPELCREIRRLSDHLVKRSVWLFGGDGWAYDIGYGGLDHVLASGENVNVFVFDTEVYSNTGGQASKATPTGAVAQFAYAGKRRKKKDLGLMAMSYGNVYVAQVCMGASPMQLIKTLHEAEAYDGPSLIIAYAPCINHGLRCGMGKVQAEEKTAVEVGYWQLYRYDPRRAAEGKHPFQLDSKEPTGDFRSFLMGEVRYASLWKALPEQADELLSQTEAEAKARYAKYKELSK